MISSHTICAISTPPGEGGIGVIRISGPEAISIVSLFFRGKNPARIPDRHLTRGRFAEPSGDKVLDDVLCVVMRAPNSYTGEDVVEISAHGNPRLLSRMVGMLLQAGCRLAERGEFTKRAFLNGKLDLTQAEGVIDMVKAKTAMGMEAALNQLEGKLGRFLKGIRAEILETLSPIEAGIDFPEEDVPEIPRQTLLAQVARISNKVDDILQRASSGRIMREGLCAVIAGKPNVGKSSLLNVLLQEGRAIVTDVPGTTRDTIEEWVDLKGIPVKLVDTAGIRDSSDAVEKIGINRSREALLRGDLLLLVLDRASPLESQDLELLDLAGKKPSIVVLNKMDLAGPLTAQDVEKLYKGPVVSLSALRNEGLESLEERIVEEAQGWTPSSDTPLLTNLRHQEALERAAQYLKESLRTLEANLPLDLVALDLRGASEAIGEITGERYTEEMIHKIFSQFCIGK